MKELIAHRTLLPVFETFADKVGFHDGDWHGTFAQHQDRTLRIADAMKPLKRELRRPYWEQKEPKVPTFAAGSGRR